MGRGTDLVVSGGAQDVVGSSQTVALYGFVCRRLKRRVRRRVVREKSRGMVVGERDM